MKTYTLREVADSYDIPRLVIEKYLDKLKKYNIFIEIKDENSLRAISEVDIDCIRDLKEKMDKKNRPTNLGQIAYQYAMKKAGGKFPKINKKLTTPRTPKVKSRIRIATSNWKDSDDTTCQSCGRKIRNIYGQIKCGC